MRLLLLLFMPVLLVACSQEWHQASPFPRGYVTHNQIDKSPPGPKVDKEEALHRNEAIMPIQEEGEWEDSYDDE